MRGLPLSHMPLRQGGVKCVTVSSLKLQFLYEASGCVLTENIYAPFDLPPFERSPLDGYALRASDTTEADA